MALIHGHADDWIATRTRARLARIRLCARVKVIARFPIGRIRIRAHTRGGIARSCVVALVKCRAYNRICTRTCTRLTRIRLRAGIAVTACRAVGDIRIGTSARHGITGSSNVALVERRADHWIGTAAGAIGARIRLCTSIAVIANGAFRCLRIRANARRWIAYTHNVALIRRRAHDGIGARTRTGLASIRLRTRIAVITRRSVGHETIRGTRTARSGAYFFDIALSGGASTNRSGCTA